VDEALIKTGTCIVLAHNDVDDSVSHRSYNAVGEAITLDADGGDDDEHEGDEYDSEEERMSESDGDEHCSLSAVQTSVDGSLRGDVQLRK
jgi:hypothetical protein